MKEIWKDVPGFDGYYECSDRGHVRSLDRTVIDKNGRVMNYKGRRLNPSLNRQGYLQTGLSKNNEHRNYGLHVLVAILFLGHIPDGHETVVNHKDNNPLNNRLSNLELRSQRENTSIDKWRYNCSSKATGVSRYKPNQKWLSQIRINGTVINLGYFDIEDEAAQAYKIALKFIDQYKGDAKVFRTFIKSKM